MVDWAVKRSAGLEVIDEFLERARTMIQAGYCAMTYLGRLMEGTSGMTYTYNHISICASCLLQLSACSVGWTRSRKISSIAYICSHPVPSLSLHSIEILIYIDPLELAY